MLIWQEPASFAARQAHLRPWTALVTNPVSFTTTFLSSCLPSTKWLSWVASIDWMKYFPSDKMILVHLLQDLLFSGGSKETRRNLS